MRLFIFLISIFTVVHGSLFAQFDEPIELDDWPNNSAADIHIIDLDLDGEPELIGIDANRAYLINEDSENEELFTLPLGIYVGSKVLDFNNDGISELIVLNNQDALIYEIANNTLEFADVVFLGNPEFPIPFSPQLLDVYTHSDGTEDLFFSDGSDINRIHSQFGTYSVEFVAEVNTFGSFSNPNAATVQFIDHNGDGLLDLFWVKKSFSVFTVEVALSNGVSFAPATSLTFDTDDFTIASSTPVFNGPSFSMDVDNDGDQDFVVSSYETQSIHWMENISSTMIGVPQLLSVSFNTETEGSSPNKMIKYDIDGDGFMDFITSTSQHLSWYRNNGNATFERILINEVPSLALNIGEIDNNNAPDIVYSARGEQTVQSYVYLALDAKDPPISNFSESGFDICSTSKTLRNKSTCFFPNSTVLWDFGNGEQSSEVHPTFTYEESGTYEVSLEVCNDYGCDTSYSEISVVSPSVELPETVPLGIPFEFVDNTPFIENRTWSFGDGNISNEAVVEHTYTFPGVYFVQLFLNTTAPTVCQFVFEKEVTVPPLLEDDDGLIVFPNPMNDQCQVVFENKNNEPYRIQIFNNLGQEIFDDETAVSFYYAFDNELLIEGVYFIHLTLNGVFIDTKKLIVLEP